MNKDNTTDTDRQRWGWLIKKAMSQEDLLEGDYLVVVLEPDNRITRKKFSDLKNAQAYADDAASENNPENPIAIVLDSGFRLVHEGNPYYAQSAAHGPLGTDKIIL